MTLQLTFSLLRMGRDRDDGDNGSPFLLALGFIGAVMPKNAVRAGGVILSIRFEHFLALGTIQGRELVRIKAWMARIYFQVTDGLPHLLEDRSLRRRIFERRILLIRRGRESNFPMQAYSLACLANEPR